MNAPRKLTPGEIALLRQQVREEARRLALLILFQMAHEALLP